MTGLRDIAESNLKTDSLRRYLCKKYQMPPTDPRYLAYTPEQAWAELLEDLIEKDPAKVTKLFGEKKEAVQYVTGNTEIDAVEAANARGDFDEVARLLDSWGKPGEEAPAAKIEEDVFADSYTGDERGE